jgi:hypothetical protein
MRPAVLSAALVAALSFTALSPKLAQAQVVIYPTVSSSPYNYGYGYPSYNYTWAWSNPNYNTYSAAWSNPFNYGTWIWYNSNPYSGFTGLGYTAPYPTSWRGRSRW